MGSGSQNLEKIEHIVVLMMENRSFDHMLGYLKLNGVGVACSSPVLEHCRGPTSCCCSTGFTPSRFGLRAGQQVREAGRAERTSAA